MSTSLYWRPIPKKSKDSSLGYQLKFSISQKLWGHDGSLCSDWTELDSDFIPYLEGVRDTGNDEVSKEAEKLIGLIEKYGGVQLSLIG